MTQESGSWSSSQKTAFPYIQNAVQSGLNATESLRQYRSGGGAIRDSLWYSLYKQEFSFNGVRDNVKQIPMTYSVTDAMFEPVDYDFREQYVMQMKVRGYSKDTESYITRWVTVESDKVITKREWVYGANQAISDSLGSADLTVSAVLEWVPLQKSGVVRF